jgi:hypothetical protein
MAENRDADAAATPVHEFCLADPNDISRHSEWRFDFRQIEPGPMETKIILRSSPGVTLVEFHLDRGFHQLGCSPTDTVTLGLPVTPALHSWRGAAIDPHGPGIAKAMSAFG